jgi:hypothetical protein
MSIKLCLLRTGETIIGDLKEVIDHAENKTLGYKISNPYVVNFEFRNTLEVKEDRVSTSTEDNAGIKFAFWAPLAAERDFNFPYEFIDVIYEPHRDISSSYNNVVNHYVEENTITQVIDGEDAIITYNERLEDEVRQLNLNDENQNTLTEGE